MTTFAANHVLATPTDVDDAATLLFNLKTGLTPPLTAQPKELPLDLPPLDATPPRNDCEDGALEVDSLVEKLRQPDLLEAEWKALRPDTGKQWKPGKKRSDLKSAVSNMSGWRGLRDRAIHAGCSDPIKWKACMWFECAQFLGIDLSQYLVFKPDARQASCQDNAAPSVITKRAKVSPARRRVRSPKVRAAPIKVAKPTNPKQGPIQLRRLDEIETKWRMRKNVTTWRDGQSRDTLKGAVNKLDGWANMRDLLTKTWGAAAHWKKSQWLEVAEELAMDLNIYFPISTPTAVTTDGVTNQHGRGRPAKAKSLQPVSNRDMAQRSKGSSNATSPGRTSGVSSFGRPTGRQTLLHPADEKLDKSVVDSLTQNTESHSGEDSDEDTTEVQDQLFIALQDELSPNADSSAAGGLDLEGSAFQCSPRVGVQQQHALPSAPQMSQLQPEPLVHVQTAMAVCQPDVLAQPPISQEAKSELPASRDNTAPVLVPINHNVPFSPQTQCLHHYHNTMHKRKEHPECATNDDRSLDQSWYGTESQKPKPNPSMTPDNAIVAALAVRLGAQQSPFANGTNLSPRSRKRARDDLFLRGLA